MKKKMLALLITIMAGVTLTGCQQTITKAFGGSMTVNLEPNRKLEEITWKEDSLWYLTRPMTENDAAETHTFEESSSSGLFEGVVTIIELREN